MLVNMKIITINKQNKQNKQNKVLRASAALLLSCCCCNRAAAAALRCAGLKEAKKAGRPAVIIVLLGYGVMEFVKLLDFCLYLQYTWPFHTHI